MSWLGKFFCGPRPQPIKHDLLRFGDDGISLHALYSGCFLIGATGSGKTSFMQLLLRSLAEHHSRPGILWCAAKCDDADLAERVARRAGRSADVIRFRADGKHTVDLFGYLQKNLNQSADGIARFCDRMAGLAVGNENCGNDKIWQVQGTLLQSHGLALISAANEKATPQALFDLIVGMPKDYSTAGSDEFLTKTPFGKILIKAQKRLDNGELSAVEELAFRRAVVYFLNYIPGAGDRFVGSVGATAISGLTPFLQPPFQQMFGGPKTTIPPDLLLDGKIIILDFPAVLGPNAYVAQAAYTQLAQCLLLASPQGSRRPVVLVRDECQWLVSPDWDSRVQTIARSHGIISISACQGHAPLTNAFGGGDAARHRALAFLGSHATHVLFNPGSDVDTRDFYVKLFGQSKQLMFSATQQQNQNPGMIDQMLGVTHSPSVGWSEQLQNIVAPEILTSLKRGGPEHRFIVEGMLYQAGHLFSNGYPFMKLAIQQDTSQ